MDKGIIDKCINDNKVFLQMIKYACECSMTAFNEEDYKYNIEHLIDLHHELINQYVCFKDLADEVIELYKSFYKIYDIAEFGIWSDWSIDVKYVILWQCKFIRYEDVIIKLCSELEKYKYK